MASHESSRGRPEAGGRSTPSISPVSQASCLANERSTKAESTTAQRLRALPAVHVVVDRLADDGWMEQVGKSRMTLVVREVIDEYRAGIVSASRAANGHESGGETGAVLDAIVVRAVDRLRRAGKSRLARVINATGVILHTGLGRAPLADAAVDALADAAGGYAPVELNLETGQRGKRRQIVESLICELTGAAAATVVNNNAAALLITLHTLARDREVIVSRGELIEIGGSFRLPTIIETGSSILREVGTTNKTRLSDYISGINENTAAILKVHPSNYRVKGFTEETTIEELVRVGRAHELPVIHDVGSGLLTDRHAQWMPNSEPIASHSIDAGADVVLFSGDKLLGGPQSGIIAGRADLIDQIESNPFMRAMRTDKLTLAALESTLELHLDHETAQRDIPVLAMLSASVERLSRRAQALVESLEPLGETAEVSIASTEAQLGGGSTPGESIPSVALSIVPRDGSVDALAQRLRKGQRGVVARIADGALLFDLRTVAEHDDDHLAAAILDAVSEA